MPSIKKDQFNSISFSQNPQIQTEPQTQIHCNTTVQHNRSFIEQGDRWCYMYFNTRLAMVSWLLRHFTVAHSCQWGKPVATDWAPWWFYGTWRLGCGEFEFGDARFPHPSSKTWNFQNWLLDFSTIEPGRNIWKSTTKKKHSHSTNPLEVINLTS